MVISRRAVFVVLVAIVTLLGSSATRAQSDGNEVVLPLAPDPARCSIEPRSLAEVRAVWEATLASPVPAPEEIPADLHGTPADDATVQAVTELLVNVLACAANGNDGLRDAAMLTDDHLQDNVNGLTEEEFTAWYTESPVPSDPEHWIILYAIHNVEVLADGRIIVHPDVIVPGVGHFIDTLLLKQIGDTLYIDQSQSGESNLYPVTSSLIATPAP